MQMTAFYQHSPSAPAAGIPTVTKLHEDHEVQPAESPLRSSVVQLLARAQSLPCSAAAQSFTQLVPPLSRFQLALDVVLPVLDSRVDVSRPRSSSVPVYYSPVVSLFLAWMTLASVMLTLTSRTRLLCMFN